ncbi:bifunctional glutamate/proline--tRNA ligase [Fopius arisanus]|uniref:Bifunctional glutamate/proline--tRNA ligase n=1 Tax=Fopius arisanus TaxID=64838 RepID=A0A9R1TB73_9HYME|nr:PREDICTED: bifunctional glutamate/proline--tRNA ligase [Fopius arisanus]
MKLIASVADLPLGALIASEVVNSAKKGEITVELSKELKSPISAQLLIDGKVFCETSTDVGRFLARTVDTDLYGGDNNIDRTQVDSWISFAVGPLSVVKSWPTSIEFLDKALVTKTWLVSKRLTLADIFVFSTLRGLFYTPAHFQNYCNVNRWFNEMSSLPSVQKYSSLLKKPSQAVSASSKIAKASKEIPSPEGRKQEGKFIELPGAEEGKVVVRFPPEASGFLHIGHAKAALLNAYYAETFKGQLIMRFDDTNPAKETVEFEQAILEDLRLLEVKADRFTHSSDYFELMLTYCEKLIKEGKAFVDDTPGETMKELREKRLPSTNRDNPVDKNLELWKEMQKGSKRGQECCVRAKIDYESANGCMRDPTIYRCKPEPHPRTGTKYKVYPTYDFACPIVDAVENVTHTLRTTEYHDRDDQFFWFIEALGLRKPHVWAYSRLNMTNTVLSKRKLTWFVDQGLVDGWDDPRFPTVRGILRRGMTVEGLKQFIISQGSSRSVVFMEWDKIWSINKKVVDPVAVRYTALNEDELIPVHVSGAIEGVLTVQNHPKDPSRGTKEVKTGPLVLIERTDAETLTEGQNATFINWGNLMIEAIKKENGVITAVNAKLNIDNKDYKNTVKLTWLAAKSPAKEVSAEELLNCYAVYFDHIISKPVLGKDDDFKDFVAKDTRKEVKLLGEFELKRVKKGEIIQLQRKGFFRCDVPYKSATSFSCREQPLILFHIPDGHVASTASSAAPPAVKKNAAVGGSSKKGLGEIIKSIELQGNKIRDLKSAKSDKSVIDPEVQKLLALKAEYKQIAGSDWKPGVTAPASSSAPASSKDLGEIIKGIEVQGNKIRDLKSAKSDKSVIDPEVQKLLALKAEYKQIAGSDWKPGVTAPVSSSAPASSKDLGEIIKSIELQGNKIRDLKSAKSDKSVIDPEVQKLLALKAEYKQIAGSDWKPGVTAPASSSAPASSKDLGEIIKSIELQGNKIRDLKSAKSDKSVIDPEVQKLLALKAEYKQIAGSDWKPGVKAPVSSSASKDLVTSHKKGTDQGDTVPALKTAKPDGDIVEENLKHLIAMKENYKEASRKEKKPNQAPQSTASSSSNNPDDLSRKIKEQADQIEEQIKLLSSLKSQFKSATGKEWSPTAPSAEPSSNKADELSRQIAEQGDKIRQLKSKKAEKGVIDDEVKTLLKLKNEYKTATGEDWKPPADTSKKTSKPSEKPKKDKPKVDKKQEKKEPSKTGTRLGLEAKKNENLPDWFSQVITKGEMIEYSDISGCYILRPWSFSVWEAIRDFFDGEIKKLGVENSAFPMFVSKAALEREKDHIADFAPEVAWVTKSGDSDLAEPIAIRPTSETVMYPFYAKWLKSHRDLPLKLNQWNSVVRWEFKHPQPFLRTREFLWQEGHSAFLTKPEADEEVLVILDLYAQIYEDLLAIPVVRGRKSDKEKFAGGDYTTTVEAYISASGRAIQGGTSHHLGQNFSKMFEILVEGAEEGSEKTYVYQNSWGITTRTIGVMVMVHGDDKGLVLPPRVAKVQAIIVPCGITAATSAEDRERLMVECKKLEAELVEGGEVKVRGDYRDNYSPGWKFNHWELKGVPVRIEVGFKDLEKGEVTLVRRDTSAKTTAKRTQAKNEIKQLLEEIHNNMFATAKSELQSHVKQTNDWNEFCKLLDQKNLLLSPFCGGISCEEQIKADSTRSDDEEPGAPSMGAKSLCIPFDQPKVSLESLKCIHPKCSERPKFFTLFGRSY